MAQPTSVKMDPPTPTIAWVRRRFLWLYFLIIWISVLPGVIMEYYYFTFFGTPELWLWMWVILPWNILGAYYLTIVWATYVAKFFLWWDRRFCKPREGVFARDPKDKDYCHFHLRNLIRKFPIWLLYSGPFPWLKEGWMHRRLGAKIGKNVAIHDAFLSLDFVEIGDNVILGWGAVVKSYWYELDRFILGHVKLGNDVIIGTKAAVMPFTDLGDGVVVDAESTVMPRTTIPPNTFVHGKPVVPGKIKDVPFSE